MKRNEKLNKNAWVRQNREMILSKLGNTCQVCGTDKNIQVHHKKYTNYLEDLQILCLEHHSDLHSNLSEKDGGLKATVNVSENNGYGVIKIQSKKFSRLIGRKIKLRVYEKKGEVNE